MDDFNRISLLLCVCALASCQNTSDENRPVFQAASASTNLIEQSGNQVLSEQGHYRLHWRAIPADIPMNGYFDLEVLVSEPLKPITYPIDLEVDAGMAAHNHGMHSKALVVRKGNQHFQVKGMLFHMPGAWQMRFSISRGMMKDEVIVGVNL